MTNTTAPDPVIICQCDECGVEFREDAAGAYFGQKIVICPDCEAASKASDPTTTIRGATWK